MPTPNPNSPTNPARPGSPQREAPPGVQLVPAGTPDLDEEPGTEEQEILWEGGQGEQADLSVMQQSANARIQGSSIPVPTKLLRMLPAMRDAAKDPSMPASMRAMYRAAVLSIEQRRKNGQ